MPHGTTDGQADRVIFGHIDAAQQRVAADNFAALAIQAMRQAWPCSIFSPANRGISTPVLTLAKGGMNPLPNNQSCWDSVPEFAPGGVEASII